MKPMSNPSMPKPNPRNGCLSGSPVNGRNIVRNGKERNSKSLPDKPKRALTAYNMFFHSERKRLLESLPMKMDKKPKKGHGKIDFTTLAKTISAKWKALPAEDRVPYAKMALQDKMRYYKQLQEWQDSNARQQRLRDAASPDSGTAPTVKTNSSPSPDHLRSHQMAGERQFHNGGVSFVGQPMDQMPRPLGVSGGLENIAPLPLSREPFGSTQKQQYEELAHRLGSECVDILVRTFLPCERTPTIY